MLAGYLLLGLFATRLARRGIHAAAPVRRRASRSTSLALAAIVLRRARQLRSGGRCTAWAPRSTSSRSRVLNEGFAKELAGRANTALNLMMFVGSFATQWGIGVVVDARARALARRHRRRAAAARSRSCSSLDRRSPTPGSRSAGGGTRPRAPAARGLRRRRCDAHRHAPAHPRHLRHLHGRHRRDRARRAGHTRHRLRRQRLSADEHAARGARHRAHRGLRRRRSSTASRADADVFVVGNVVSRGNPLMEAILDARPAATCRGRSGCSRTCSRDKWVLAVAGTHGKTTTSAMLAWILEHAGLEPGLPDRRRAARLRRVGAAHRQRRSSSSRPTSTTPRSSTSARSSSTTGRARRSSTTSSTTTPTSSPTSRRSRRSSTTSCARCRGSGRLVVNGGEASLARVLARGCWSEVERFGLAEVPGTGPDWTIAVDGTILLGGAPQGTLRVRRRRGRHNQLNALAAIAAARHAGVPVAREPRRARRVPRRQAPAGGARHASTASPSTTTSRTTRRRSRRRIDGLRREVGDARILAVLEPRSNTMKLGAMKDALPGSLAARRPRVLLRGEPRLGRGAARSRRSGDRACGARRPRRAGRRDRRARRAPGDHVLVMSNGGFGGIHEKLLAALAA